jgi:hypothetical protein
MLDRSLARCANSASEPDCRLDVGASVLCRHAAGVSLVAAHGGVRRAPIEEISPA